MLPKRVKCNHGYWAPLSYPSLKMADTRPLIQLYRGSENPHKYMLFRFASKEKSTDPMIPHQTDAAVRDQGLEIFQQPKNRMNRRSTDIIRRVLPKYNHKCYQYV